MDDPCWTFDNPLPNDFPASYTDDTMNWNTSAPSVSPDAYSEPFSTQGSWLNNPQTQSPYYHPWPLGPAVTDESATTPASPLLSPSNEQCRFAGGAPTSSSRTSGNTAESSLAEEVARLALLVGKLCDSRDVQHPVLDPGNSCEQQMAVLERTVERIRHAEMSDSTVAFPATRREAGLSTARGRRAKACARCSSRKRGCDLKDQTASRTCTPCSKANKVCIPPPPSHA